MAYVYLTAFVTTAVNTERKDTSVCGGSLPYV